ncbi:hypothetical protein GIB67_014526 [Kingdonia uniflora]|uniref:Uncharacterized protein n=1 Tax=Kingdonia uniflora TaxID=39325 RepID=A0A7J7NQR8_9MAGN|nr:hypothetical protein GIB67_014526 [Kingdonia uniflora]
MERTYEKAEECLKINYYGAKKVTEALLPLLQLSNSARIANVSSVYGLLSLTRFESRSQWIYKDLGKEISQVLYMGVLTPEDGAKGPVMLALLPDDVPSGFYFNQMEISSFHLRCSFSYVK